MTPNLRRLLDSTMKDARREERRRLWKRIKLAFVLNFAGMLGKLLAFTTVLVICLVLAAVGYFGLIWRLK